MLAKRGPELFGEKAGDEVARTARREGHQDTNGPFGIFRGKCRRRERSGAFATRGWSGSTSHGWK